MTLPWHLYFMAFIYFIAGLNHFRVPRLYAKMIPPYIKFPVVMNQLSGAAEIILGIALCIPVISGYAAWGIILLLIAVFPANIQMLTDRKAALGLPKWLLIVRLPLQLVLIYWAYLYT